MGQLPSVSMHLGVGFVTKIYRVAWEVRDGVPLINRRVSSSGEGAAWPDEEGLRLKEEERLEWCRVMALGGTLYHWVLVRHFESGKVSVYVDHAFEGHGVASFSSTELRFRVGNQVAVLRVGFNEQSKLSYTYTLSLLNPDGSSTKVKELNEQLIDNHDASLLECEVASARIEADPRAQGTGKEPKIAGVYTIVSRVRSQNAPTNLSSAGLEQSKRFSDFVELDRKVRSAFSGSHMLSSLPDLPPKHSKLFSDHKDAQFLQQRRQGLQTYMAKLVALPRIPQNPDVLQFLGVLPSHSISNAPPVVTL